MAEKDKVSLDGLLITKQAFREVEAIYKRSNGQKVLRKLKENEYRTLIRLRD